MNTLGKLFTITSFGESHGPAMGGVIDGVPAGIDIDMEALQRFVNRRRPGQGKTGTTNRDEGDQVEILSGIWQGKTLGTPIGFIVRNSNQRSHDYDHLQQCYRPSHADYTWQAKMGIRDHRGGGRASARTTLSCVVAGGIALQMLQGLGITIEAHIAQVGNAKGDERQMQQVIEQAQQQGDTVGGIIACVIHGMPAGIGEPIYGKLHAQLAAAMMNINAAHGFDYGTGFDLATACGSEVMDKFVKRADGTIGTTTNHSGGIQGGISNGEDITLRVAFKPVPTLMRDTPAISSDGDPVTLHPHGRHDSCVLPRAVPIVEATAAIVVLDNYLMQQARHLTIVTP